MCFSCTNFESKVHTKAIYSTTIRFYLPRYDHGSFVLEKERTHALLYNDSFIGVVILYRKVCRRLTPVLLFCHV